MCATVVSTDHPLRMHADLAEVMDSFQPDVVVQEMAELAAAPLATSRSIQRAVPAPISRLLRATPAVVTSMLRGPGSVGGSDDAQVWLSELGTARPLVYLTGEPKPRRRQRRRQASVGSRRPFVNCPRRPPVLRRP